MKKISNFLVFVIVLFMNLVFVSNLYSKDLSVGRILLGTSTPAECSAGQLFYDTDDDALYICKTKNSWSLVQVSVDLEAAAYLRWFEGSAASPFTPGDTTPEVTIRTIHDVDEATPITITDFVDSDGDHSEFVSGDFFGLFLNSSDVTIDFETNLYIIGNVGVNYTGSDVDVPLLIFVFWEDNWRCMNLNSGFSDPLTFPIKLKRGHYTDSDGFDMTVAQSFNYTHYATGVGTINLAPVAVDMNFCIENHTDANVTVNPDDTGTEDTIRLNGQALTQGQSVTGTEYGDIICCEYYAADVWSCMAYGYTGD